MIRRSTLKPVAQPVAVKPTKHRCGSCGVTIPTMVHRPFICSYCAGRPTWGRDGYFAEMIEDEIQMMETRYGRRFSPGNRADWVRHLSRKAAWDTEPFERRRTV